MNVLIETMYGLHEFFWQFIDGQSHGNMGAENNMDVPTEVNEVRADCVLRKLKILFIWSNFKNYKISKHIITFL